METIYNTHNIIAELRLSNKEHRSVKLNNIHLPLRGGGEKDAIHIASTAKLK
jgi:hypothetical protein